MERGNIMTIRYYYPDHPYHEDWEREVFSDSVSYIWDAVERIKANGGHILEIISPPPGCDDRKDGEHPEMIFGLKMYISRIKWDGKWRTQYRFCFPGWCAVESLRFSDVKRMIHGMSEPYAKPEF